MDSNYPLHYLGNKNIIKEGSQLHDVFYFTDIHGCYDLYRAIIDYCDKQDAECTIIFGGDACDRGPDGYRIMKELLANPRVIYLKGNHEDLFVKAAYEINEKFKFPNLSKEYLYSHFYAALNYNYKYPDIALYLYNGGLETLVDWIIDGQPMDFVQQIKKLPLTFSYEQYDFCHAGGSYRVFKEVAEREYYELPITENDRDNLIWDRTQDVGWETGRICIHGHTPTIHLRTKYYGKDKSIENIHPCAWVGDFFEDKWHGWRLDMDTGAAQSKIAFLFNVLTQEVIGFNNLLGKVEIFSRYKINFNS